MSSEPRSKKRTRASSSPRAVRTISGTSGSICDATPLAWRTASSSASVSPLTSQITRSGWRAFSWLGERGRFRVGDQHLVAVGGEVVGEEATGGRVLLAEQDRAGGLHALLSLRTLEA